jgi:flagellar secretion chaperone FliS
MMAYGDKLSGLKQYSQNRLQSEIESASPHRLVQMLMEGVLEKVAKAKGCMQQGDAQLKGVHVNWAVSIIQGLQVSLDKERGGEIAVHLDELYDYMMRRLAQAHQDNDPAMLDEVISLIREIKSAWDAIPPELHYGPERQAAPVVAGGR